ncbi:hypothetical protein, partial [Pantoea brenneri]|uniref:hypothetical protein n=1 Tax=Pantoea brenneri TaxID=472694 RepID=UPI00289F3DA7
MHPTVKAFAMARFTPGAGAEKIQPMVKAFAMARFTPGAGAEKIHPMVKAFVMARFTPGAGAEKIHPIVKTHSSSLTLGPRLPWRGTLYSSGETFLPLDFCVALKKLPGSV